MKTFIFILLTFALLTSCSQGPISGKYQREDDGLTIEMRKFSDGTIEGIIVGGATDTWKLNQTKLQFDPDSKVREDDRIVYFKNISYSMVGEDGGYAMVSVMMRWYKDDSKFEIIYDESDNEPAIFNKVKEK